MFDWVSSLSFNFRLKLGRLTISICLKSASAVARAREGRKRKAGREGGASAPSVF